MMLMEKDVIKGLISIIVPVWNSEKYLCRCIDSLITQTYKSLEILLIDDGSTDSSPDICDRYAEADERITVFHLRHSGVAAARNVGINNIHGEFVGFADSDDMVSFDMYECLMKALIETASDISVCKRVDVRSCSEIITEDHFHENIRAFSPDEALKDLFTENRYFFHSLWDKLYRRELFCGITFPNKYICEDAAVTHILFSRTEKIAFIDAGLYYYFYRADSLTSRKFNRQKITDWFNTRAETANYYRAQGNKRLFKYSSVWLLRLSYPLWCEAYENDRRLAEQILKISRKYFSLSFIRELRFRTFIKMKLFISAPRLLRAIVGRQYIR